MVSTYLKFLFFIQCWKGLTANSQLPSPGRLSLKQSNEFCVNLTWDKPSNLSTCQVEYVVSLTKGKRVSPPYIVRNTFRLQILTSEDMRCKDGQYSVKTKPITSSCERTESDPATITWPPPMELVKDFRCLFYAKNTMNCTWLPTKIIPNLQIYWTTEVTTLKLCQHMYKDLERIGCHLRVPIEEDEVYFMVNGSLGGTSVTNTFRRIPRHNVKPPPPTLEITEAKLGRSLRFSWNPPDICSQNKQCWIYKINYTKCNVAMEVNHTQPKTDLLVPYDPYCQYRVQIKSIFRLDFGAGGSELSEVTIYGVDGDPNWSLMLATILLPIILSACVSLTLVCLWRYRTIISPIIPEPPLIIKDWMDRTKKPVEKLYLAVPEETYCQISLVSDSPSKQTDS